MDPSWVKDVTLKSESPEPLGFLNESHLQLFFLLPTYFSGCYFLMDITVVIEESTSPDFHLAVLQFGSMPLG